MQHIRKNRPSIILLDLLMPKKDGFHVLEEVKNDLELRTIPVVVLSNLGGDEEQGEGQPVHGGAGQQPCLAIERA